MTVKAYGAHAGDQPLEAMEITRRAPGSHDVQIEIAFCGVCRRHGEESAQQHKQIRFHWDCLFCFRGWPRQLVAGVRQHKRSNQMPITFALSAS